MQPACEAGAVLALLEGGCGGARAAAESVRALYGAVREPWLTRALLQYHARTASARALELLARAPEPHARHLLDALHDQLRDHAERAARRHALAALAPLVARRPPWLHLLPAHPLARDLLRAARTEREPLPLLHALLALAALVPAAPALAAAHAPDLADALLRASAAPDAHAALAARALFRAVYATHPCTALDALRGAGAELAAGAARDAWERAVAALAAGVRLHPALVTGSRAHEAEAARWARSEPHDVLAECRRLSLPPRDSPAPAPAPASAPAPSPPPDPAPLIWRHSPAPLPGSTAQAARACGALRPGGEGWFALGERSGAEAAPHTPLPADGDAPEPEPEPAVEATPENTPRLAFRFPPDGGGGAARAIGRRAASPPAAAAAAGAAPAVAARLARVAAERRAADSPVPFGGAPPAAAARPEPRHRPAAPAPPPTGSGDPEDSEVRELTARAAAPPPDWAEAERAAPLPPDPRRAAPAPRRPAARGPPPRRAASAGPEPAARRRDAAVQTVDVWPEPYEFLLADFYRTPPDDANDQPMIHSIRFYLRQSLESSEPCERLDAYLAELYAGRGGAAAAAAGGGGGGGGGGELAEQLALAHAQLMYERWRREAHAERNRRLLGRCRQVRALEAHNAALQERVRALALERDALRERAHAPRPAPAAGAGAAGAGAGAALDALEEALRGERAARLRAEAARAEAEAQRAQDAAELQRTRTESFEAARHVEALARAALAAERRAEHVRRLRRELLVLAEREARLGEAAAAALGAAPDAAAAAAAAEGGGAVERALRAAAARADAEAEAAGARAEAAAARAHELEAALAARDAHVAELRRATRHAAEEGAARLRAARDKYAALLCVVRAREARQLERLAAPPAPAPAPPANCG